MLPGVIWLQATFDSRDKRGCLDYFLQAQKEELDSEGNILVDDESIRGLVVDFLVGGKELFYMNIKSSKASIVRRTSNSC